MAVQDEKTGRGMTLEEDIELFDEAAGGFLLIWW